MLDFYNIKYIFTINHSALPFFGAFVTLYVVIYDWVYENEVNNLRQITHMHFDFPTPKGGLQAMQKMWKPFQAMENE